MNKVCTRYGRPEKSWSLRISFSRPGNEVLVMERHGNEVLVLERHGHEVHYTKYIYHLFVCLFVCCPC